jgi:hypothetical protein
MSLVIEDIPLQKSIKISGPDLVQCINIGRLRYQTNLAAKIPEQKYTNYKSGLDVCIQGVIGEMATLKMFQLPLDVLQDTSLNCRRRDRGDMFYKGLKVDVKTPEYHNRPLQTREENRAYAADLYALCTLQRIKPPVISVISLPSESNIDTMKDDHNNNNNNNSALHPELVSTYREDEIIEVIYHGAVCKQVLYRPQNYTVRWGRGFYMVYSRSLTTMEAAHQQYLEESANKNHNSLTSTSQENNITGKRKLNDFSPQPNLAVDFFNHKKTTNT